MVSEELRRAVRGMLGGPGSVTAADLSGGFDSSAVVATAAGMVPAGGVLLAFTAAPLGETDCLNGRFIDEAERASATAAMLGVSLTAVSAPPKSPMETLDQWLPALQEPLANACNLAWIDACYTAAAEAGAHSYLIGSRGNFTISRGGTQRIAQLARSGSLVTLARELAAFRHYSGGSWPGLLAMAFGDFMPTGLWNRIAPPRRRRRMTANWASDVLLRSDSAAVEAADRWWAEREISADLYSEETPRSRRLSIESMDEGMVVHAVRAQRGIVIRDPFASRRLVELCIRLPAEVFFRDGQPRRLARDLLRGKVPDRIVDERGRGWQGANWRSGFEAARPEMLAEIDAISEDPGLSGLLDAEKMRSLVLAWPRDGWNEWAQISLYRSILFRAIGAARFARFVREWPAER